MTTEDDEDGCIGVEECDDRDCSDRREFIMTATIEISCSVRAHNADEARRIADDEVPFIPDPDEDVIENWTVDLDIQVEDALDAARAVAKHQAEIDAFLAAKRADA